MFGADALEGVALLGYVRAGLPFLDEGLRAGERALLGRREDRAASLLPALERGPLHLPGKRKRHLAAGQAERDVLLDVAPEREGNRDLDRVARLVEHRVANGDGPDDADEVEAAPLEDADGRRAGLGRALHQRLEGQDRLAHVVGAGVEVAVEVDLEGESLEVAAHELLEREVETRDADLGPAGLLADLEARRVVLEEDRGALGIDGRDGTLDQAHRRSCLRRMSFASSKSMRRTTCSSTRTAWIWIAPGWMTID